jgi:hypothetical protein
MTYADVLHAEVLATQRAIVREQLALLCLGPKGEHFAGDEWERRADLLADPATCGAYLRGELADLM